MLEDELGLQTTKTARVTIVEDTSDFYAVVDHYIVWAGSPEVTLPVLDNDLATGENSTNLAVVNLGLDTQAPPAPERVIFNNGIVGFTPPETAGVEVFTYEISDGTTERREAEINITIVDNYPNLLPLDDAFCVARDSSDLSFDVLANDASFPLLGWELTLTEVSTPDNGGSAQVVGGSSISYTPLSTFFGTETFTYTVEDNFGQSAIATISVAVGSLVTGPDSYIALENSSDNAFQVLLNDDWINRFAADYEIVGFSAPDQGGTVEVDGTGPNNQLLYTPLADFVGEETFTYTVTDLTGGILIETVTVEVIAEESDRAFAELRIELTGVNDMPLLGGIEDGSTDDKTAIGLFDNLTLSDVDEDGDQEQTASLSFDSTLGTIAITAGRADVNSSTLGDIITLSLIHI